MLGSWWRASLCATATVAALSFAGPAAAQLRQPRIVGGHPATLPYPFAAYVEVQAGGQAYACGGSLVAARYVVTAGHCLDGKVARIDVAIGVSHVDHSKPLASPQNAVPAADRYLNATGVVHPGFAMVGGEPAMDAAVITLPRPAPQAQLRLPRIQDAALWAPGTPAATIGWGRTCSPLGPSCPGTLPDDLLEVAQRVRPDAACAASYGSYDAATMLCAGGETGKDTCEGDSGGPLLTGDGAGALVLAGITSFGADVCATGVPGVYTRVAATGIDRWLRSRIPQVEIDASATAPLPGEPVTFTAVPSNPRGRGPYGGYDALSWDLDGDGTFSEASGQTTVTRTMTAGLNTVAVRATSAAGDSETRRIGVRTVQRSPVAFATPAVRVREGRPATLTITRTGAGTGTVTVTPVGGTARLHRDVASTDGITVGFGPADTTRTVSFATVDDRRHGPDRTFRVTLGDFTGDLVAGTPVSATVTIVDDDAAVRVAAVRSGRVHRGRFALRVTADRPGRATTRVTDGRGRRAGGASARTLRRAGTRTVRVRLSRRIARAVARGERRRVRVRVRFRPADGAHAVTVRRTVRLRAAT